MAIYRGIGGTADSNTDATVSDVTEKAVAAATSASNASASATQSANSATASANSASNASNSANSAAISAAAAAASVEAINASYLGVQTSDPSVDLNGDHGTAGDWYYNSATQVTRIYDGAAWINGVISTNGLLQSSNNLSDLNDAAESRTNLGLGPAATTASTAYATAAQGALADSALQSFTETDPVFTAWDKSTGISITESQISDFGSYEPADATILKDADINSTVQAYDADTAKLDVTQSWTAAQRGATNTNASATGSITLDFSAYQNFVLTMSGNVTLSNPSTEAVGQSGFIVFIQDATGGRTVSLGSEYETAGAAGLTLSTAASTTDVVPYIVAASGRILLGTPQLAFA